LAEGLAIPHLLHRDVLGINLALSGIDGDFLECRTVERVNHNLSLAFKTSLEEIYLQIDILANQEVFEGGQVLDGLGLLVAKHLHVMVFGIADILKSSHCLRHRVWLSGEGTACCSVPENVYVQRGEMGR
jgi:hypothetical protein